MAYQTFRVEITRGEARDSAPVSIEITAYIDRMPETNEATIGRLSRALRGVWNSKRRGGCDPPSVPVSGRWGLR